MRHHELHSWFCSAATLPFLPPERIGYTQGTQKQILRNADTQLESILCLVILYFLYPDCVESFFMWDNLG